MNNFRTKDFLRYFGIFVPKWSPLFCLPRSTPVSADNALKEQPGQAESSLSGTKTRHWDFEEPHLHWVMGLIRSLNGWCNLVA